MRRLLTAVLIAGMSIIAESVALGADASFPSSGFPTYSYTPPRYAPLVFRYWTGAYLGLNSGWGWTMSNNLNASGIFGGGQVGYNYQVGSFVFGIEGDGAFARIRQGLGGTA